MDLKNKNEIEKLKLKNVFIPEFWNVETVFEIIKNNESIFLPKIFGITSNAFIKLMSKIFPSKPEEMSYAEYVKSLNYGKPVFRVASEDEDYEGDK